MRVKSVLRIFIIVVYWIILIPFLLFFPALQSWDAMPEPLDKLPMLIGLCLFVLVAAAISARKLLTHFTVILLLMALGLFIFARNQGHLPEAPTETDFAILKQTKQLLANEERWDRAEDGSCVLGSETMTLYCALRQASHDVKGSFRHRQPSLQMVRKRIDETMPTANYGHRLGGFNADPEVHLEELHSLLDGAIDEMKIGLSNPVCQIPCQVLRLVS